MKVRFSFNSRCTTPRLLMQAGGLLCLAGSAMLVSEPASSQEYIDVEAERAAQEIRSGAPSGAVSYGVGTTPGTAVTRTLPPPSAPSAAASQENVGGLFNQVQQLQNEVMRLNGMVEQLSYELRQLKEQSLERYVDLDKRLAGGAAVVPSTEAGDAANAGAGGSGTSNVPEQAGEGEAYRAAYALVRGQEFTSAVDAFQGFLQRYPDGRYAPNAHYWLGELYLVVDPMDAEAARQSFMLLLTQYPDNAKVPDALFKLGRVHYIKGNSDRAREFLNRVIREYPDSPAARLASDFKDQNL
ncbi:MAG: tol-pal system protein YbgF [Pseudomonadota bacterium]